MACNCNRNNIFKTSKFGTCAFCLYATIAGLISSWLLLLPFVFIRVSAALLHWLFLPAIFFSGWFVIHLLAYYYKRRRPRRVQS